MIERGEEVVISKTPRVTEEVLVRKEADERTETVKDTVQKTEVESAGTARNGPKGEALAGLWHGRSLTGD